MKKQKVSREEKMSLIQEKLETGVRKIFESEKYQEYIRTMAKFPNYSINNCILIASQRPDASYVYIYGATGMQSSGCSVCKRIVLWDFDHNIAYKASAKKYAG